MDKKNLAAALTTAFALATGAGSALAAEPVKQQSKPQISTSQVANFNDHAKGVVFQRNLERDIRNEPILIKEAAGRYLVHEPTALFEGGGVGKLQSYNKEELEKKFGPSEGIRTYQQYRADADILKATPDLGAKLSDNAFDMGTRLKDLHGDMKAAGETYGPLPAKLQRELGK
ncbi:MAG: hypothetical protein JWO78_347 [Micavibrio sp.]|nr:hypothetical protein [Micavibrio sp.]